MDNYLFQFRELINPNDNIPKKPRGIEELAQFIDFECFRPILNKHSHPKKDKKPKNNAGRPPYDVVKMFRILIIQSLYNLSNDEMEFQLNDRISFMRFCAIGACDPIPDATTIWRFKESLGEDGSRELFDYFEKQMVDAGLEFSAGSIIDASFVEARKQRNTPEENAYIKENAKAPEGWSENKKRQKDVDGQWAKKGDETHFGFKLHAVVDAVTKIITNHTTTPANVNDIVPMVDLMQDNTKYLLADSGYLGQEKETKLAEKEIKLHAVKKRKKGQEQLSDEDKQYNNQVSKVRCRVEHVFGTIKQMGGDLVRSVGLKRCTRFVNLVCLGYNMKRFAFLCRSGQLCPNN